MTAVIDKLLHPKSVAIIGMSSKPGSPGHVVLGNLKLNDFSGPIHLVGRSGGEVEGLPVLPTVDELPANIDVAVFTLPAAGVKEAVQGCVRRGSRIGDHLLGWFCRDRRT